MFVKNAHGIVQWRQGAEV